MVAGACESRDDFAIHAAANTSRTRGSDGRSKTDSRTRSSRTHATAEHGERSRCSTGSLPGYGGWVLGKGVAGRRRTVDQPNIPAPHPPYPGEGSPPDIRPQRHREHFPGKVLHRGMSAPLTLDVRPVGGLSASRTAWTRRSRYERTLSRPRTPAEALAAFLGHARRMAPNPIVAHRPTSIITKMPRTLDLSRHAARCHRRSLVADGTCRVLPDRPRSFTDFESCDDRRYAQSNARRSHAVR